MSQVAETKEVTIEGALADAASYPGEERLVQEITEYPEVLPRLAPSILPLPWCNGYHVLHPLVFQAVLDLLDKKPSVPELLSLALQHGVGLTAADAARDGRWWLPHQLVAMLGPRFGAEIPVEASRWVIPARYPVPILQDLVQVQMDGQAARSLVANQGWGSSIPVDGPEDLRLLLGGRVRMPLLEDLAALTVADPRAAMMALLSDGFAGVVQQIGIMAMQNAVWMDGNWDGRLGFRLRDAPILCLLEGSVTMVPGWLLLVLRGLGLSCPGLHASALFEVESALVRACGGGEVRETQMGPYVLLDPSLGRLLLRLPIDWKEVRQL